MQATIEILEQQLEILKTNEPINRSEGKIEQADLEARQIEEIDTAIHALRNEIRKMIY
jgi:hypothetical protein